MDLTMAILEDCVEDWYGLWEIYANVAERIGANPAAAWSNEIAAEPAFCTQLRNEIARLLDDGLLDAAIWTYEAPQPLSADDLRNLRLDSVLWKSPALTDADEQLRVAATDLGRARYFGGSSQRA
jgi:hypothetical protein